MWEVVAGIALGIGLGGWGCVGAGLLAVGVAVAALVRHTPPRLPWWLVPGALYGTAMLADALLRDRAPGPVGLLAAVLRCGAEAGIVWALTPGVVALAVTLRPGGPVRPTPRRAVGEVALLALASIPVFALGPEDTVIRLLFALGPAPVILLSLRTSDPLRETRQQAALVHLAAGSWIAAGVGGSILLDLLLLGELSPGSEGLLALALPVLALAAAGLWIGGLPSRGRVVAAVAPPMLMLLLAAGARGWTEVRLIARIEAFGPLPEAVTGGVELPLHHCLTGHGLPPCEQGPVLWLARPDEEVMVERARHRSDALHLVVRSDGALRAFPVEVRKASGIRVRIERDGLGYRIGDIALADLEAAEREVAAAIRSCSAEALGLHVAEGWTAQEIVSLCESRRCVIERTSTGLPGPCVRHAGGWALPCRAGATCSGHPGSTLICAGSGGCTLVRASDGTEPIRFLCPGGGCTIEARTGPIELGCSGCTVHIDDPAQVTYVP